jgi:integrase
MKNNNHPRKGDRIAVDPIRKKADIEAIRRMLKDCPRDELLFTAGINNGLRVGDLLRLKVKDIKHLKPGDSIQIKEQKTGKTNIFFVNKAVYKSLQNYFSALNPDDDAFLFKSRKGKAPLQSQAVSKKVKAWTRAINLQGNFGTHSLRKTWGYIQRTVYGVGFEVLCKRYNHSSPSITIRYLGVSDRDVQEILLHDI